MKALKISAIVLGVLVVALHIFPIRTIRVKQAQAQALAERFVGEHSYYKGENWDVDLGAPLVKFEGERTATEIHVEIAIMVAGVEKTTGAMLGISGVPEFSGGIGNEVFLAEPRLDTFDLDSLSGVKETGAKMAINAVLGDEVLRGILKDVPIYRPTDEELAIMGLPTSFVHLRSAKAENGELVLKFGVGLW